MASPRPLPNNVHRLHGNPGKRRPRVEAPAPGAGAGPLKAPAWLSTGGKAAWRELIPAVERAWPDFLSPVDVPALAMMVEHYATAIEAAKAMRGGRGAGGNKPVPIDTDPAHRDRRRRHPAAQVFKDETAAYLTIAREFGFTAVGRIGLDLSQLPAFDGDEDDDAGIFDTP